MVSLIKPKINEKKIFFLTLILLISINCSRDEETTSSEPPTISKKNETLTADGVPYPEDYFDEFLVDLDLSDAQRKAFITNANRFIEICIGQNFFLEDDQGKQIGMKNPLWELYKTNSWPIYFHFEEYQGTISSAIIDRIHSDYQMHANNWVKGLKSYDSNFPSDPLEIKIFGFVFNENIEIDPTFYEKYGNYPIVTQFDLTNEESPWDIAYRNSVQKFDYNWYAIEDFSTLKVVGNRTDLSSTVEFYPTNWESYEHPEGIDYFQTKFWYRIPWDAVAQRQYLKMGGNILDPTTGATNATIFLHEMGHCFFLDDLYDRGKYPNADEIPSIMNTSNEISDFDIMTLRMVWKHQKEQ